MLWVMAIADWHVLTMVFLNMGFSMGVQNTIKNPLMCSLVKFVPTGHLYLKIRRAGEE